MGEEQPLAEAGLAVAHLGIDRQAGQRLAAFEEIRLECQRHQRRAQPGHLEAELPRHVIAEAGRPDLGDRQPAGGDHQRGAFHHAARRLHPVAAIRQRGNAADRGPQPQFGAGTGAFRQQHVDDLLRAVIAEQLAELLFMERDAMLFHQGDEIILRVAAEGRFAEMPVARQERRRRGMDVGEIAAPAAGDADLLGWLFRMVEDQHPPPARAGDPPAHQPGGPAADDQHINLFRHGPASAPAADLDGGQHIGLIGDFLGVQRIRKFREFGKHLAHRLHMRLVFIDPDGNDLVRLFLRSRDPAIGLQPVLFQQVWNIGRDAGEQRRMFRILEGPDRHPHYRHLVTAS